MSRHKYIYFNKTTNYYTFRKFYKDITITKSFKNKINALCYKYIQCLKLKAGIDKFNKSIVSFWRN
jgi:N-acetylneuraminic acid mutarotase